MTETITTILIATAGSLIIVTASIEIAALIAAGKYISSKKADRFITLYEKEYLAHGMDKNRTMFYGSTTMPYIGRSPIPFGSKWYINNLGQIPRWSKASDTLDKMAMQFPKPNINHYI